MLFRILGPLRIWDGAVWAPVRAPQQRTLVATLLLEPGNAVSTDRIINEIWGEHPPSTARATVHGYVMRLRRLFGRGTDCPLVTRGGGYELMIGDDDLDAAVFQRLAEAGQRSIAEGKPDMGIVQLTEGLALWHGAALADVPATPSVAAAVELLDQNRITALEARIDARLTLSEHTEVVDELHRLVEEYPLREQLWGQLMLALYRCGRRADALAAYQRARRTMVDDLGLEPGRPLRDLHAAILTEDLALVVPARPAAPEPRPDEEITPAQLPADVAGFTGREDARARLDALLPAGGSHLGVVVIAAVGGIAGVGKTALAVHWAHRVRHHFPDGQLHVDLRGYSAGTPLRPVEALTRFLAALGVPPARIPSDVDTAAATYRSLLAGRRMLVLLDNASHPDQVRPLLPNSPGCLVLVTSRDNLAGLVARDGAVQLALDTLTAGDARTLLTRLVGAERAQREPAALAGLAELCGYLPLALRIAAANLIVQPELTISDYVGQLTRDRLAALQVGDDPQAAVRIAFDHSYANLPAEARRLFRLLGLVPGPHATAPTAAALAGVPAIRATRLLARLAAAHLLEEHTPGRYRFHDLLRAYAAERAEHEPDRQAALARMYDHYLDGVTAAARLLYPHVLRLPEPEHAAAVRFDDHQQASAWLDAERPNLVAATVHAAGHGFAASAWRLADALRGYLYLRMHTGDWRQTAGAGLVAAEAAGDPQAQAAAQVSLATLHWAQGRHQDAIDHYTTALRLARQAGWAEGESAALGNLGNLNWALGRLDTAAEHYSRALDLYRQTGQAASQATALGNLGLVHFGQGRLDLAMDHCAQALALHRTTGSHSGEARTLTHLGDIHLAAQRHDEALTALTGALALLRQIGDRNIEGDTLRTLAAVHRDAGRTHQALDLAGTAVDLARDTGDRRLEAGTLTTRGTVRHRLGQYRLAADDHRHALRIARDLGNRYVETEALIGLAAAHHSAGDRDEANHLVDEALGLARSGGYWLLEDQALAVLAGL